MFHLVSQLVGLEEPNV